MKRTAATVIACACALFTATAQTAGKSGFEFLNLPYSGHVSALGGENISLIEDDATLAISNPALLQSVSDRTISLGYMNYIGDVPAFSANYVKAIKDRITVAGIAQYVNYGTMKNTDDDANILGDFKASDLALSAQLSYYLGKDFVGGLTTKFIYSQIGDYTSTAVAVDLGLNYFDAKHDLSVSLVAKNLGGQLSAFFDEYELLPFDLQFGVTKKITGMPLRLSFTADELHKWNYSAWRHLTVGADLMVGRQFYLAAGYNFRRAHEMAIESYDQWGDNVSSSHGAGLSIGAGMQMERFKLHVAYGKYHLASSNLIFNVAFNL